ncbi:MAG: hypothetical protein GY754_45965 [bacterium]|nr:hypothetical protein [bacterium]
MKNLVIILIPFIIALCGCKLNDNAVSKAVSRDITPPVVSIDYPANGKTFGSGKILIQGSAADDLEVTKVETSINNGSFSEASKGFSSGSETLEWISYVDTSSLSNGSHTITAKATDLWDNTTTASIYIIVDNGTPLAVISGAPPVISDKTDLNVSVSGAGIVAYKYNLDDGGWSDEISAEVPITASGLGAGEHGLLIIGKKIVDSKEVWQDATTEATEFFWSVNTKVKFILSDGANGDLFGKRVAISSDGKTIVTGTEHMEGWSGNVFVYSWTGNSWNETKLKASDSADFLNFGSSVAISSDGNTIAVGAFDAKDFGGCSGSVYIFSRLGSSWNQTQKLTASDAAAEDYFGFSVAISSDGNSIVVGARFNDDKGENSGSAYVYNWTGSRWNETQKLTASDGAADDCFGIDVAVSSSGSTIVVGAYKNKDNGANSGSVYIFSRSGSSWNQTQKLLASDGAVGDRFGYRVVISSDGSTIAVGAYYDNDNGEGSGSAYVYNWTGSSWNETKIIASDGAAGDLFGDSLAISPEGSTIVVGARYDDDKGERSGSVYIYNWVGSSWDETKIIASDGTTENSFGWGVAVSSGGNSVIVGAPGVNRCGALYLFYQ